MPSDDRVSATLPLLEPRVSALRSAMASAAEEVRAYLASHGANGTDRVAHTDAELGAFAASRIDPAAFASLFGDGERLEARHADMMRRGLDALVQLAGRSDLAAAVVPPGGSLAAAVDEALAEVGRAFAAARAITRARGGGLAKGEEFPVPDAFPFALWSRAERRLASPLVVELDGADLDAASLARFLDGNQAIVLAVRPPVPAAALVRLITPGTFVMQTASVTDIGRMMSHDGPGIAALVDDRAAHFVHDPAAGDAMHERLTVSHVPERPLGWVGRWSAAQQAEELKQLVQLATRPEAPAVAAAAAGGEPSATPADKLAAWLLKQADLTDLA